MVSRVAAPGFSYASGTWRRVSIVQATNPLVITRKVLESLTLRLCPPARLVRLVRPRIWRFFIPSLTYP